MMLTPYFSAPKKVAKNFVPMDQKTLWKSALAELELALSDANFQTWFKGKTEIGSIEGEGIEIGCNSTYTKDWLEQRYLGQIKAILDRLTETNTRLVFTVSKDLKTFSQKSSEKAQSNNPLFSDEETGKLQEKLEASKLNPNYTFDNFVVGSSNQLAFAVGKAISESPGKIYNPLFLYGGVGLGKTHLMHAIGKGAVNTNPKIKVLYSTSESFTNNMIEAIQTRSTKEFRNKYRTLDILIIDDIQFIAGRETTQEEFFHTFNELYGNGKQVIISSDRPPAAISKLEERLKSRFEGGMIADIQAPDLDMKEAILLSKVRQRGLDIPEEVLHYLAQNGSSSIRDLEGSLTRLVTQARINNTSLSVELAKSFIDQRQNRSLTDKASPKEILETICDYFNLRQADLKGSGRSAKFVLPRQITMYLLRKDLGLQYENIADLLGGRDHSTIMYGVEKIDNNVENSDKLRGLVADIRAKLHP